MRGWMLEPRLGAFGEGAGGGVVVQLAEQSGRIRECAAPPQRDDIQEPAIYSLGADLTLGKVGQ